MKMMESSQLELASQEAEFHLQYAVLSFHSTQQDVQLESDQLYQSMLVWAR